MLQEENEEAPMASTEVAEQLKIAVGQENAHALITSMMGDKLMDICDELVINGVPDVKKGITRKMAGVGAIAGAYHLIPATITYCRSTKPQHSP